MADPRYAPFLGAKWACEDCGVAVTNQATHTRFHSILSAQAWALAVLLVEHKCCLPLGHGEPCRCYCTVIRADALPELTLF